MESQQSKQKQQHWLARYNREEHILDLSNYELKCSQYEVDS